MNATYLVLIAAVPLLLYIGSGLIFYRVAIARTKKKFVTEDPDMPAAVHAPDEELRAWWDAQKKEELRIASEEGLELFADYLPGKNDADLVAVLVHGYTGTGPTMKRYARLFKERFECGVLTPDLRGHGRSEGSYIGFGLHDAHDLRLWIDRLIEMKGPHVRIVLFGVSMGGATVLIASGSDLPPNVACVVSDCAYSNARDQLAYKLKTQFHLPVFPFLPALRTVAKRLAGYDIAQASPRTAVARAKIPLLIIHGAADKYVPTSMANEIFEAAASPKELYLVENAGHAESFQAAATAYADKVAAFVRAALSPVRELQR